MKAEHGKKTLSKTGKKTYPGDVLSSYSANIKFSSPRAKEETILIPKVKLVKHKPDRINLSSSASKWKGYLNTVNINDSDLGVTSGKHYLWLIKVKSN